MGGVLYVVVITLHPCPDFPLLKQVHAWIDMLAVAQRYFQRDDFCGDVILDAAARIRF